MREAVCVACQDLDLEALQYHFCLVSLVDGPVVLDHLGSTRGNVVYRYGCCWVFSC